MGISSVIGSAATDTTTSSTASAASSTAMDKNSFLKLLIAQMQHQDPLNPTEGTEYVTQLAQFSLVEQSQNQATQLTNISTQVGGLASNEATALVGKSVTVSNAAGIAWDGLTATGASVNLAASSAKTTVQIQDSTGKTIRTIDAGAHSAGPLPVAWDGKDSTGQTAAKGNYTLKVTATTVDGKSIDVKNTVSGIVTKVNFDKGYPELVLSSGATAPISDLVGVGGTNQ